MNSHNMLETKNISLFSMLGNGMRYSVPTFQRDYSWEQDQWEDLWNDIVQVYEEKLTHYLGAVVLQNTHPKHYIIIDGQQRLATITLFALACIRKLRVLIDLGIEKEKNIERIDILSKQFIGDKDAASLTYSSKISLNKNNNDFFQYHLLTFREPVMINKLSGSHKLLYDAYQFFLNKVDKYFEHNKKGEIISDFLLTVFDNMMVIQIAVEDELNAFTLFETLNARGVSLSVTDLLKNYIFSLASPIDLPTVEAKWNSIIEIIGLKNFPTYLRHYWNSKHPFTKHNALFKSMRKGIMDHYDLFGILDDLEKNAFVYQALQNPSDELWFSNKALKKKIKELELFQVKQCYPLLLASYEKMKGEFYNIISIVNILSFRYTVIGGDHSGKIEEIYNKVALKVYKNEIKTPYQIAHALIELYPSDADFKNQFANKIINTKRSKKLVRYILFEIENQLSNNIYDFEENTATIEHILPENPDREWEELFGINILNYIYKIGNYTLLEEGKNRDLGRESFEIKREIYKESNFKITREINTLEWLPSNVEKRQEHLAKIAASIWKLTYFQ